MQSLGIENTNGDSETIEEGAVQALASQLNGDVLLPGNDAYHGARAVWNGMIDRHPALIARCADADDVAHAVRFARENQMLVSIRGGGHNIAGSAVCDGGLVIDLSQMRDVRVDAASRTAYVQPGATLADVDRATQAHGLAMPMGINSTTGIAGLTLGGGFGWLSRKYGLTIDNLVAADVVLADGQQLRASETENAELFWALRGGGGNFGVVTSFEFRLHEVGPEVFAGPIIYRHEDAPAVLRNLRDFNARSPDELSCWAVLRSAPPLPFLAEAYHGTDVLIVVVFHAGTVVEGERLLAPLRTFGSPIVDAAGPVPYAAFQQAFDPLLTEGARNYWKSHNFAVLSDAAIDTAIRYAKTLPSPHSEIFFGQIGGAASRVPTAATAYPHRDAAYAMNVHTRWLDASMDETSIRWAREFYAAMSPFSTGGTYVNFVSEQEGEERSAYGENYDRLAALKQRYDPGNLFRMNQNVRPA